MNAWNLTHGGAGPAPGTSSSSPHFVAALIDSIGEADFGKALLSNLNALVQVDFFSVYQLNTLSPPAMYLSSSMDTVDVSADCFRSYQEKLHTADHTFDSAKELADAGGLAMTYSHHTHFSQAHRAAIYSRHGIQDRLSIVCRAEGGILLATNFYRFENGRLFGSRDVETVESVAAAVAACIRKHISDRRKQALPGGVSMPRLAAALAEHRPRLTSRELEVCAGLLLGRTYEGIAANLNVSLATVKTYRARAYEKLGIHFKSQLFAMATRMIGGEPGGEAGQAFAGRPEGGSSH